MTKRDPHPFNPNMQALVNPRSPALRKRDEDDKKHCDAMRKIDNINFDKALANELKDLEL